MQKTRVLPHTATVLCICLVSLLCSFLPSQVLTLSIYETAFNFISMEEDQQDYFILPTPSNSVSKLISLQANLIYNSLVSVFSPIQSLFSMVFESYQVAEETHDNVESAVQSVPSHIISVSILLLKKLGLFFLSAAYVCMILISLLILAAVVGVNLVQLWVEEPVFVKESIHFDYTEAHPTAVFFFNGGVSGVYGYTKQNHRSVPVGHTFCVSLVLVMPESDFNRELGMFQLSAELQSLHGNVIARSSQPCILRFRSSPVRLARTVMMGVPLVLGISSETQKINVPIMRHKEHNRRTNALIITLHPRAGTTSLPQIYEAEIVINSHLPWAKELIRKWKWTFYVWMSLYVYIMLLMFLLCCYKPLIFLMTPEYNSSDHRVTELTREEEPIALQIRELGNVSEPSELLRRWRRIRNRRKNILSRIGVPETFGSSASSISLINREDVTSMSMEYDVEDSESVCMG
ncbi:seipin-1 [Gastrolobium bilobum]|uniref:seipin-1 n=1 Tax=Gastrolobium bilobum TaxID=150636 RepID=UPI002AB11875|nr:seipin-1 [Gastrolobium bilobum]